MAAPKGGKLTNDQIIKDFIYKVSNLVEYSSLKGNHPMFSRKGSEVVEPNFGRVTDQANFDSGTAANVKISSYAPGSNSSPIGKPALTDLGLVGEYPTAATFKSVLKGWMEDYAKVRRVTVQNSGNSFLNTSSTNFVIRFNAPNPPHLAGIQSDFETDIVAADSMITAGTIIDSEFVNNFINKCQENWVRNCHDAATMGTLETFSYNYCHSNHINHANHGSRGRR